MNNAEAVTIQQSPNDRIRKYTAESVNRKIDLESERITRGVVTQGPEAIRQRLTEIDKEWDIDRVLMLNFSVLVFAQLVAATRNKKWLWGPLIQTPFLFMHSTLGWCPPSLWFRPMGFRTRREIQAERDALIRALMISKQNHLEKDLTVGAH